MDDRQAATELREEARALRRRASMLERAARRAPAESSQLASDMWTEGGSLISRADLLERAAKVLDPGKQETWTAKKITPICTS